MALTRVALNQQCPYGIRQLAAVVLKKYVKVGAEVQARPVLKAPPGFKV